MEKFIEENRENVLKLVMEKYMTIEKNVRHPAAEVVFCSQCKLIYVLLWGSGAGCVGCGVGYCPSCEPKHQAECEICENVFCLGKCGDRYAGRCRDCILRIKKASDDSDVCSSLNNLTL